MPLSGKATKFSTVKNSSTTIANVLNKKGDKQPSGDTKPNKADKNKSKFTGEFTTDFTAKNGLIYVNAELNGKLASFVLDSGLGSDLILNSNSKLLEDLKESDVCISGMGSGKCRQIETSWVSTFNWKGIMVSDVDVVAMPLSNLGGNDNFAGIIGFNMFKNYQLTFDYQYHNLKVSTNKDLEKEIKENGKLLSTIPFEMKEHMPVFDVEINGKTYKMGLDTGASVNVINIKYFDGFTNSLTKIQEVSMKGFGGESKVKRGSIKETKIGGLAYDNMDYNFENASLNNLNKEYKYGIDGLIGYDFLKKYITVVDFNSKEIRIYEGSKN